MSLARLLLTFAVVGTLLGFLAATLVYPGYLNSQLCGFGGDKSLSSPCKDTVEKATHALVRAQLNGGGAGAVVGLVAGVGFFVWRRRRARPASPPGSAA